MTTDEYIRLYAFAGAFALIALWELVAPRRVQVVPRSSRWPNSLALMALNSVLVRLIFTLLPVELSARWTEAGWGLMNHYGLSGWYGILAAIMALDLAIYLQHVLFHALPLFWRFHMAHHADIDFDLTTGIRFHPFEMLLTTVVKLIAVALIGPPVVAVLAYEILLNAFSMFIHSNSRLNKTADVLLRYALVTPDMHRVHHSILGSETNTNFGAMFSWWDRLLGTYRDQPAAGHEGMTIGLARFRDVKRQSLWWILTVPFRGRNDLPVRPTGK